jgi:hypothetical protein
LDNVLFFPIWTGSLHFETDLELMMREAESGNNIYFLFCNGELKICDNNINQSRLQCKECIKKRRRALRIMNKKNIYLINFMHYKQIKINRSLPNAINDINSLKKLKVDSYNIGYAIASSLANKLDETSFEDCKEQISLLFSEGYSFYEYIKRIIIGYNINKGYIFNARFCFSRAFFDAFLEKSITVYNHDRGATLYKYDILENKLFHDISEYTKRVNALWDKEQDISLKKNIADDFFKKRYFGKSTNYISFTNEQDIRKLPEDVNMYKKIVVFFTSSDFEFNYTSDEYTYKFYNSQSDGIMKIVDSLKNCSDIGIYVREHPNQRNRNNKQRTALKEIHADNFHLIPAESEISSYALLTKANVVITFNSTMGIEATYWGIPSILCSNAIYEKFNIVYQPSSHEEVIKMILFDLKPIVSDDVFKYGYYNSISGIDFKYYKPIDFTQGLFLNKNLHIDKIYFFKLKIKNKFPRFYKYLKIISKFVIK